MAQFDRIYRLTVGDDVDAVLIQSNPREQGLNISFDIDKDLTQQTNKCRVEVYNLSDSTAKKIERDDIVCILEVGYSEDVGLRRIFVGEVVGAWTRLSGSDKITTLELSDGQKAIRDSLVSLSYAPGVNRRKVIDDIASDMGIAVTYAEGLTFTRFANGFSFIGPGRSCLDKVCAGTRLNWSIQNNVLQIIEIGGTTQNYALKLTKESGLIGSPERIVKGVKRIDKEQSREVEKTKADRKAGWKLRSLLQPALNPGDIIYVESRTVTGWFVIETLKHIGTYAGNDWYTDMEVYEIGGEMNNAQ